MVAEAAKVAFASRVDELTFAQRHEVEVLDALVVVLQHALAELVLINDFANILEDELVRRKIFVCTDAVTFLLRLDYGDVGVLAELETLVLALVAAPAVAQALHFGRTVDTVRILIASKIQARSIICIFTSANR